MSNITGPGEAAYQVTPGQPLENNTITFVSASSGTLVVSVPDATNFTNTVNMTLAVNAGVHTLPFDMGKESSVVSWTPDDVGVPLVGIVYR